MYNREYVSLGKDFSLAEKCPIAGELNRESEWEVDPVGATLQNGCVLGSHGSVSMICRCDSRLTDDSLVPPTSDSRDEVLPRRLADDGPRKRDSRLEYLHVRPRVVQR